MPDFLDEMRLADRPPRIGLLSGFFQEHSTSEVWQHTREAAQKLAQAGATVEEVQLPPSFATCHSCQRVVMNVECAAFHEEFYRDRADEYGPRIRSGIEMGMLVPGVDYLKAQRLRRVFREEMTGMLDGYDVVLTPATPAPAPKDLNTTGDAAFQSPWTSSGLPTIVIPSGMSGDGLPLGIQLAAAPWQEGGLLGAAQWAQKALGVNIAPPQNA